MTVLIDAAPQTSNQKDAIPTQKSPLKNFDQGFLLHREDADDFEPRRGLVMPAVRARMEAEKEFLPPSISMLREIFVQAGITYPQNQDSVSEKLDMFTDRALIAHAIYVQQIADSQSPTGNNRVKYGEVLDLLEGIKNTLMKAMDAFVKDDFVQSHPTSIKPNATEAYAVAALLTLDANKITPKFLVDPIEEIHE